MARWPSARSGSRAALPRRDRTTAAPPAGLSCRRARARSSLLFPSPLAGMSRDVAKELLQRSARRRRERLLGDDDLLHPVEPEGTEVGTQLAPRDERPDRAPEEEAEGLHH